jgi:hypothetical protein
MTRSAIKQTVAQQSIVGLLLASGLTGQPLSICATLFYAALCGRKACISSWYKAVSSVRLKAYVFTQSSNHGCFCLALVIILQEEGE